jgi:hypothetical protein
VTAEQVGPAPGKPTTMLALEAVVIDWLPGARIPSWPGAPGGFTKKEAGDTFAVRPVQMAQENRSQNDHDPKNGNGIPDSCGLRPSFTENAPKGGSLGQGLRPCTPLTL